MFELLPCKQLIPVSAGPLYTSNLACHPLAIVELYGKEIGHQSEASPLLTRILTDVFAETFLIVLLCICHNLLITQSHLLIQAALTNDSHFLSELGVMDYSLLVGISEADGQLVVGIIDYIRQYTWDKQLETYVKSSGVLGGGSKQVWTNVPKSAHTTDPIENLALSCNARNTGCMLIWFRLRKNFGLNCTTDTWITKFEIMSASCSMFVRQKHQFSDGCCKCFLTWARLQLTVMHQCFCDVADVMPCSFWLCKRVNEHEFNWCLFSEMQPTIISPKLYKERFQRAMMQYLVTVPGPFTFPTSFSASANDDEASIPGDGV